MLARIQTIISLAIGMIIMACQNPVAEDGNSQKAITAFTIGISIADQEVLYTGNISESAEFVY